MNLAADSKKVYIVTKIESQKRPGRYNVYVDGQYAFPVSEDVMIRFRLLKGAELDEDQITTLKLADDQSKAWDSALNYLSYQQRTEKEIVDYLVKKEIPEAVIAPVMARLVDEHLIDDQRFAHSYVRTMKATSDKGPAVIQRQLKQKAVSDTFIAEALAADYPHDDQLERLADLVEKLKRQYHRQMPKIQRQKVQQRLVEKGFSFDIVGEAMAETTFEMDEELQTNLLATQAEKLWRRYRAKPPRERQLKVRQALYRKGFDGDDISRWITAQTADE